MNKADAAEDVPVATATEPESVSSKVKKPKRMKREKTDRAMTVSIDPPTSPQESPSPYQSDDSSKHSIPAVPGAIEQLRRRILHPDNTVHYEERQRQLNTAMRVMDQLSRKINKDDPTQKAMLSGMYELMLVIAERFTLLTHGIMQLEMMNRAESLPAIREARRKFRQVAYVQGERQSQQHLDVAGTLKLLSELSRHSLD
jgi:hypothetical protein